MIDAHNYLPVGSVVLLKNGIKKAVIVGIIQNSIDENKNVKEYDYIGVLYPEGFFTTETMFLFNHDSITDVIFRGYENSEREEFVNKLDANMKLLENVKM